MISSKKGIELSVNFLVIILLSISIFGFGMVFLNQFLGEAQDVRQITEEELDNRIGTLTCSKAERFCISQDRIEITPGDYGGYRARIHNIGDRATFTVTMTPETPNRGFDRLNNPITSVPTEFDLLFDGNEILDRNEETDVRIAVLVPVDAPAGNYIFNLRLTSDHTDITAYDEYRKLYVEVP